jgi:triacylglycerol lipase
MVDSVHPFDVGTELAGTAASVSKVVEGARREILTNIRAKLLATLGPGCSKEIGWSSGLPLPDRNVTQRFADLYRSFASGSTAGLTGLTGAQALFVPGLFAKHYPTYMDENVKSLSALGFAVKRADIDTDDAVEVNAAVLATLLGAHLESPVIVVAHSKGGVDVATALARHPELCSAVRAAVFIQSPYGGTPIATDIEADRHIASAASAFIQDILAGQPAALSDLTYSARQAFVRQNPYPNVHVPTVCIGSASHAPLAATALAADYIELRYGVPSDGLVCPEDTVIPGTRSVSIQGLDHASSVLVGIPGLASVYRPETLTRAAVALALE